MRRKPRTFDSRGRLLGDDEAPSTALQDATGDVLDTVTVTATPLPPWNLATLLENPLFLIGALLLIGVLYHERDHGR
jgi:hypothetical protein